MGYVKALHMFRLFHPHSLDALNKTFRNKKCVTLNKYGLERRKKIFAYEWLDSLDKINETQLTPKEAFCSKLKPKKNITDEEFEQSKRCWRRLVVKGTKSLKPQH